MPARSADPLSRAAFEAATAEHAASISAVIAHLDAEIAVLAGVDKPSVDAATPSPRRVGTAGQSTRIAACLGVKDEIELIEPAIAHLRAIDVDFILACDAYSTDGTYEILKEYQSDGEFALLQGDARQLDAFHLWEHALAGLVSKAGCDWIVFLDADEFLTPASGSLKDCVDLEWADVLSIDRFNVPLGSAGPTMPDLLTPEAYQELLLLVKPIPGFRTYLQTHSDVPWIMGVPHPKLMARPGRIAGLKVGWHDLAATKGNEPLRRAHPTDLIMAHLPFTTLTRFAKKVENIRDVLAADDNHLSGDLAWHWRRWLELADQGRLVEEFERTIFGGETISKLRDESMIRSAAEVFADRLVEALGRA